MNSIKIKHVTLDLTTQEPQLYGNMWLRYSGIRKTGVEKWINGSLKSHYIYTFIKVETEGQIEFEFDYENNFVKVFGNTK